MKRFVIIGLIVFICLLGFVALVARLAGIGFEPKSGEDRANASFSIGKTETHSNLSSSSTSSSSDAATFNSRRVLLVQGSTHPLSQRIGTLLAQRLKDCPQIENVEMAQSPAMLAEGAEAPDLFLRIDLIALEEGGLLSHSMKATVGAFLGSVPWESSHYVQDSTTPPLVQFAWNATLDSDTTFDGIRSDRYADAARSIADQFAKGISNQLQTLSSKFPALPDLPRDFYGPYEPIGDFDFLKDAEARRVCSYYGLLTHNQTFWQFQTATNPAPQLEHIVEQLKTGQWKLLDVSLTNAGGYFIQAHQDDAELEIFPSRIGGMSLSHPEEEKSTHDFIVHYRKAFSRPERETALEKLFAEQRPIETLLAFQNSFSPAQREEFYARVEKTPASSPRACVQLVNSYLYRKQTNAALNMLLRANVLAATVNDASGLESDIRSLAKKISPGEKLELKVTPETCRELGFLEITNAAQTVEVDRDFTQPLLMFGEGERGMKIFSLTIRPPLKGSYPWTFLQSEEGSRSITSSSFNLTGKDHWQQTFTVDDQTVNVTVRPLPDGRLIHFTIYNERKA